MNSDIKVGNLVKPTGNTISGYYFFPSYNDSTRMLIVKEKDADKNIGLVLKYIKPKPLLRCDQRVLVLMDGGIYKAYLSCLEKVQ